MSETGWVWMCPQCSTSYSSAGFENFKGRCALGHAPRELVKHSELLPKWRCPACGRRYSEPEYNINDGKCSFHQSTDLDPYALGGPDDEPVKVGVETEEGEYDFGFGRPAPKPISFDDVMPRDDSLKESELYDLARSMQYDPAGEVDLMRRAIRVLVDKLGGTVPLNGMELIYIVKARDAPTPVIERQDHRFGGEVVMRVEYDK